MNSTALLPLVAGSLWVAFAASAEQAPIDFDRQIRPILSDKCYFCHGPDNEAIEGKLQLHDFGLATSNRDGRGAAIVPGKPDDSLLWQRITSPDPDEVMPPPKRHAKITPGEASLIHRWISEGAPYSELWSFKKLPLQVPIPEATHASARNAVDHFVQTGLKEKNLSPAPEAGEDLLLRRLYLTLTGLVPTPEQIAAFHADISDKAYENVVDQLLASPAFSEHLAVDWMDVSRYADSYGYQVDRGRSVALWRDWVLRAFRANLPYDQFIIHQLAGDLIPKADDQSILATAFNRLHGMKVEGGSVPEEFRVEYVADRAQTAGTAFLGLTMECCRCHDHKYDPISMKDYYKTFALFNNIDEAGLLAFFDTSVPSPTLVIADDNQKAELAKRKAAASEALTQYTAIRHSEKAAFAAWKKSWEGTVSSSGLLARYTFDELVGGKVPNTAEQAGEKNAREPQGGSIETQKNLITLKHPDVAAAGVDTITFQLKGKDRIINLSEVQILSGGSNIVKQATITQSTLYSPSYPANNLTDGNLTNFAHTHAEAAPWIAFTFPAPVKVDELKIWNRAGPDVEFRFNDAFVRYERAGKAVVTQNVGTVYATAPAGANPIALSGNKHVDGIRGKAVQFDGDTKIVVGTIGPFQRHAPFSISAAIEVPVNHKRAIILHRSQAWTDAASRGYELLIHEGKLDFALVHFSPGDEIRVRTRENIPVNAWTRIAMTYDGSGRAAGIRLFVNGEQAQTDIIRDHLTKEIRYRGKRNIELAARMRDNGFKNSKLDDLAIYDRQLTALEVRAEHTPDAKSVPDEELFAYYLAEHSEKAQAALAHLATQRKAYNEYLDGRTRMMVMQELPERRRTFVLKRGHYSDPDPHQEVEPGPPEKIFPFGPEYARDRLGFAQWLTHPEHPLTARVTVNRYWQMLFGTGIVSTTNDFGFQGALPTHPELLDYLARYFVDSGWDVRALFKHIVLSHTFRQDSAGSARLTERDPGNQWLARGPSYHMTAEMLRDSSMLAGDGLNPQFGGNSVGLTSNRRSLYVSLQRNNPSPELLIFGAPRRQVCSVKREKTATPLQPLVLMNSPLYVKNARLVALASVTSGTSDNDRLNHLFQRLTSRMPTPEEQTILLGMLREQRAYFEQEPKVATAFVQIGGGGGPPKGTPTPEFAAWATVASAVMNLDAFYMVR